MPSKAYGTHMNGFKAGDLVGIVAARKKGCIAAALFHLAWPGP
ncbi:hypothetical protein ANT2_0013 [plant metagenome]|uniref:Uncharacterized protein n=1 Tax=plant metagenome TaxID=1297885 RepID=A0A484R6C1_9ZZZZ